MGSSHEPCVDPRHTNWFVNTKGGTSPNVETLGGTWAVAGYDTKKYKSLEEANKAKDSYGYQIINILNDILKIKVKEENDMSYKIAIDAGHGSNTSGKRCPDGYREHYINVDIANYLDIALKRCGFETLRVAWDDTNAMDDTDVSLSKRQSQIKNAGCDASISCHANAYGNGTSYNTAEGVETLIHNNTSKVGDSKTLANKVQYYLIQGTNQKNRGVKTSNLAMCNCSAMKTRASILVEVGFMTNKYESELMKTDAFCKECAEEIAQGVCDYFGVTYVKTNITNPTKPLISSNAKTYTVVKGDTLSKIGAKTGVAWKTIANLNNIKFPYLVRVGQVLKLSKNSSTTTTTSSNKFIYNGLNYSLVFNPTYYSNSYSDLKRHFGTDAAKLFDHFCKNGMLEGRIASANFNVIAYKNRYPDLRKAFGDNLPLYYKHYIENGQKEGRNAT